MYNTATLRASSIGLILSGASVLRFGEFSHEATQVYLQSKKKLTREVDVRPKRNDLAT